MLSTSTILLLIAQFATLDAFSINGEQITTVNPEASWSCMSVKECLQAGGQIEDSDKCECPTIYCNHVAITVQPSEGSSSTPTPSTPSISTSASSTSPTSSSPTPSSPPSTFSTMSPSTSSESSMTSTFQSTSTPSSSTSPPNTPPAVESDTCEIFNCIFNEELCYQLNGVLKENNHGCPHQDQKCCLGADMALELYY